MPAARLVLGPDHRVQHRQQVVDGVRRRAAEHPRVQLLVARHQPHLEPGQPAQRRRDRRLVGADHPAVEDHRGVERVVDGRQVVDHRVTADLLLAVRQHAHVDAQLALLGEVERRAQQRVEVALVVGHAAPVDAAVAHGRLERRARPQLGGAGRLHVEVAVGDHGRRPVPRRGDQPVDDRVAGALDDARVADQPRHPVGRLAQLLLVLAVTRDRLDAQELAELREPCLLSADRSCPGRPRCRSASGSPAAAAARAR